MKPGTQRAMETTGSYRTLDPGELAEPGHMGYLDEAQTAKLVAHLDKNGVRDTQVQADLDYFFEQATPMEKLQGKRWYREANVETGDIAKKTGLEHDRVIAATAALSPQNEWSNNIKQSRSLATLCSEKRKITVDDGFLDQIGMRRALMHKKKGKPSESDIAREQRRAHKEFGKYRGEHTSDTMPAEIMAWTPGFGSTSGSKNVAKAIRVLRGEVSVDQTLIGPKTRSFYDNMRHPHKPGAVTIDTHQLRALTPKVPEGKRSSLFTGGGGAGTYPYYADMIRMAAKRHGMLPHEFQAVTWLVAQRTLGGRMKKGSHRTVNTPEVP